MSSTRACLALSRGIDFAGFGDQSSVEEVWRTSNCSPGADLVAMVRYGGRDLNAVRVNSLLVSIEQWSGIAIWR